MTYQREDTERAFSELDSAIAQLGVANIDQISSRFADVESAADSLESELGYLLSESEDMYEALRDWTDTGFDEPDDASRAYDIIDEFGGFEEAEEAVAQMTGTSEQAEEIEQLTKELAKLKEYHENQRLIIHAFLDRFGELDKLVNRDAVTTLMVGATQTDE